MLKMANEKVILQKTVENETAGLYHYKNAVDPSFIIETLKSSTQRKTSLYNYFFFVVLGNDDTLCFFLEKSKKAQCRQINTCQCLLFSVIILIFL